MNYSKSFNKLLLQVNKKHLQLSRKEISNTFDTKIRKKKSLLSLPSQILFKQRARNISDAYKILSAQKASLNSTSKSKKRLGLTPQKKNNQIPFNPYSSNLPNSNKPKLILQKTNESSSFNNTKSLHSDSYRVDIQIKLSLLNQKIQKMMKIKSNQNFKNEFKLFLSDHFDKQNHMIHRQNKKFDIMNQSLSKLFRCFQRNFQQEKQQMNQIIVKNKQLQDQITTLKIQLNKSNIKHVIFQRNIQKQKQLNKKLQKQLISCRNKDKKVYNSVATNTKQQIFKNIEQNQNFIHQNDQNNTAQQIYDFQHKINKLNGQLNRYHKIYTTQKKNIKQLLDVLTFLKKQGIDIQTIYDNIINGKVQINQMAKDKKNLEQSIKKLRKQQKQIYKKAKKVKLNFSCDGDNSIISVQQGLSFNYQQKSLEMDKYTYRRQQYKCKKQLSNDMKNKLKLNFEEFYQDQDEYYENQFQNQSQIYEVPDANIIDQM